MPGSAGDPLRPGEDAAPGPVDRVVPPGPAADGWIAGQLGELRRREAMDAAFRLSLVAELAGRRPARPTPPWAGRGTAGVPAFG